MNAESKTIRQVSGKSKDYSNSPEILFSKNFVQRDFRVLKGVVQNWTRMMSLG